MATDDPQDAPDLGPWLTDLQVRAKLSVRALATAMETDRSNVRAWLDGTAGMNARSLLLFLSAVGAEIKPGGPKNAPRAVNAELAEVRRRLRSLEARADRASTATAESLARLEAAIERLSERRLPQELPDQEDRP